MTNYTILTQTSRLSSYFNHAGAQDTSRKLINHKLSYDSGMVLSGCLHLNDMNFNRRKSIAWRSHDSMTFLSESLNFSKYVPPKTKAINSIQNKLSFP